LGFDSKKLGSVSKRDRLTAFNPFHEMWNVGFERCRVLLKRSLHSARDIVSRGRRELEGASPTAPPVNSNQIILLFCSHVH
jgi:hypothetical protein